MEVNNKKIVQVIKTLDIGDLSGGAERFAIDLGIALKKKGWDVEIYVFFKTHTEAEGKWTKKILNESIPLTIGNSWRGHNHIKAFISATESFHLYLEKVRPQFIHSHFQLGTVAAIWWKRRAKQSLIVRTAHLASEWESGLLGRLKSKYARHLYSKFLDGEVGVSNSITKKLSNDSNYTLVERAFIPNGINLIVKQPEDIVVTEGSKLVLGTVGRLTEQKGYSDLLNAMSIVLNEIPDLYLFIIGDGHLSEQLKNQSSALGINNKVCFTGSIENVQDYYEIMDIFVSSSLWEGLPTVLMEAMAAGVPIVATDIDGSRDLVVEDQSGWLGQPANPNSLAKAIIKACRSPEMRKKYALAGLETAKKYTMESISKQYSDFYLSIESNRRG